MIKQIKVHFVRNRARYFLLLIAVLTFLSCCFVSRDVVPNETNTVKVISGEEFYNLQKYGYNVSNAGKDAVYKPADSDPQTLIVLEPNTINKVKINFSDGYTGRIQLYYTDNMTLSEKNSWIFGGINDKSLSAYIPSGNYNLLRLDIDSEFSIKSVELIAENLVLSIKFNFVPFLIFLILLLPLIIFEKKIGFFAFIKEKCLSWYDEFLEFWKQKKYVSLSLKILSSVSFVGFFVSVALFGMLGLFGKQMRLVTVIVASLAIILNLLYYTFIKNSARSNIVLIVILIVAILSDVK